jgi:cytochrome P450
MARRARFARKVRDRVYLIVNGLRALLTHREQWDALCADPSLAAAAVEEIVRFDGPVELAPPR